MSGAQGIDTMREPCSTAPLTSSATPAAEAGGSRPTIGKPCMMNPSARPPVWYITPFGIPVVPPV